MAMGDPNPDGREWVQRSGQGNIFCHPVGGGGDGGSSRGAVFGGPSPATEWTAAATTPPSGSSTADAPGSRDRAQAQPPSGEGGAGKAARRRSRASQKAPVTVLNTDTTNFRAMVQQYTGAPAGPFQPRLIPHPADAGSVPAALDFGMRGGAARLPRQQAAVFPDLGTPRQQFLRHRDIAPALFPGGGAGGGDAHRRRPGGSASGHGSGEEGAMGPGNNPPSPATSTTAASPGGGTAFGGFFLR